MGCGLLALVLVLAPGSRAAVPDPVGLWTFDRPENPVAASAGRDLALIGSHQAIEGVYPDDGAVRIGIGSHYACQHGLVPSGPGRLVNRYSLLIDFRIAQVGPWYCFFQTDPNNLGDGDCFIRASDGAIGVAQSGYSTATVQPNVWYRLVVSADLESGRYRIYRDGDLILPGTAQEADGRFALRPTLLLFADENGEDAPIEVTRVALYDVSLSDAQAAELGGVPAENSIGDPPTVIVEPAGPVEAVTGQEATYQFAANDPDQDAVQVRVDWGIGELSSWSALVPTGQQVAFRQTYRQPGTFAIRAMARDADGKTSEWTSIQTVTVSGDPVVEFLTPPYLQNVRPDGITLMWELDAPATVKVECGPPGGPVLDQISIPQPSGAGTSIHRCVLSGLDAGKSYQFKTWIGAREGPRGEFRTAPAGPEDFSFAVWSDSQGSNHGSYSADPLEPTRSMMRHMAAGGIDLAVTTGDLAENGNAYTDTRQYYLDRVARWLGPTVPWFVGWGNHDGGRDSIIRKFADLPSKNRPGFGPGYGDFSFDYAGCHFVCLDYDSDWTAAMVWLEADLQSEANRKARFTFLFVHVPPFCELWIDGNNFLRERLVPLMETHGVDVCFSGHTHEYSRGFLNGVFYCITGGGSWLDTPESLVRDWPHMTVGGYHAIPGIAKPGPTRGGGLINEYVRVDVQGDWLTASMIGFAPDGTPRGVFDTFVRQSEQHPPEPLTIVGAVQVPNGLELHWAGPDGPYQLQHRSILGLDEWADWGAPLEAAARSVTVPIEGRTGFFRIELAR